MRRPKREVLDLKRAQEAQLEDIYKFAALESESGRPGVVLAQVGHVMGEGQQRGKMVVNFIPHKYALRIRDILQEFTDEARAASEAASGNAKHGHG